MKRAIIIVCIMLSGCGASNLHHTSMARTEAYQHEVQDPCQGPQRLRGLRSSGVVVDGIRWYCN